MKYIMNKKTVESLALHEEKSFESSQVLEYLKKHKIDYYIITEQQHLSVKIIDKFIKTMHDYLKENEPADYSKINKLLCNHRKSIIIINMSGLWKIKISFFQSSMIVVLGVFHLL
jgi:hypothetical protein